MAMVAGAVTQTIGRTVEGLGYEFVYAERLGGGLLRVTIDRDGGVQLADCERVSRQLTHVLAVENGGRRRLHGKLLEVVSGTGGERVRMQLVDDAVADGSGGATKRGARSSARVMKKAEGAVVEFALADVEKARLVPELDFRGEARSRAE